MFTMTLEEAIKEYDEIVVLKNGKFADVTKEDYSKKGYIFSLTPTTMAIDLEA